jgi:hypothetical protein
MTREKSESPPMTVVPSNAQTVRLREKRLLESCASRVLHRFRAIFVCLFFRTFYTFILLPPFVILRKLTSIPPPIHACNSFLFPHSPNLGTCPLSVLHEWCQAILPDVPPRLPEDVVEERLLFRSSFTGAVVICEIKRNEVSFEAVSASIIAIAKEAITRQANYQRRQLDEKTSSREESIPSFLSLLRPRLQKFLALARRFELVDAVQEIAMQEQAGGGGSNEEGKGGNGMTRIPPSWLSPEYASIFVEQDAIRRDFKGRARSLEYLTGLISDLYIDWHKIHGRDARGSYGAVMRALNNLSLPDAMGGRGGGGSEVGEVMWSQFITAMLASR